MLCTDRNPCPDPEWCQTGGDCETAKRFAKVEDYVHQEET